MLKHSCRLYGDTNFYAMQTMIDSNIHFFILVSLLVGLISTRTFATTDHASAFVVDRVKFFLTSMQNLVLVSHTVHAHVGPKNLRGRCSPGPWEEEVADTSQEYDSPHLCHHTKFGHASHDERAYLQRSATKF